ncbi:MAG: hypothetical protein KUG82_05910 [Pseudomonadales bacterium]|nr:hypothetical protein [Pseudomonadales bacterium]
MSNSNADLFEYTKFPLTANARTAGKWSAAEKQSDNMRLCTPGTVIN